MILVRGRTCRSSQSRFIPPIPGRSRFITATQGDRSRRAEAASSESAAVWICHGGDRTWPRIRMVSGSSSTISTKFESSIVLFQFSIGRTGHQSDTNSFYERADGIGLLICSPPNPRGPANCAPGESGDLAWCPAPKCRRRNSENRWEGWLSTHRAPASESATRPPPGRRA